MKRLTDYLYEAIALEESGKKVELKKASEYSIPEELQSRLDDDAGLRAAFEALSPGRRKSYNLPRFERKAGSHQIGARREVRADYSERARIQREAALRRDSAEFKSAETPRKFCRVQAAHL